MCSVVTKFILLIQLFSSISVNSGFWNIHLHVSHVGEYSATIHLHFDEYLLAIHLDFRE